MEGSLISTASKPSGSKWLPEKVYFVQVSNTAADIYVTASNGTPLYVGNQELSKNQIIATLLNDYSISLPDNEEDTLEARIGDLENQNNENTVLTSKIDW